VETQNLTYTFAHIGCSAEQFADGHVSKHTSRRNGEEIFRLNLALGAIAEKLGEADTPSRQMKKQQLTLVDRLRKDKWGGMVRTGAARERTGGVPRSDRREKMRPRVRH
jgi:hypothetical protein